MHRTIHKGALLAGAIAIALLNPHATYAHPHLHTHAKEKAHKVAHKLAHKPPVRHATFAVTYSAEASKKASISNSGFWLNGAGFDGAATFKHGLGLAANLTLVHARDSVSNTSTGKTTIVFGPRYTKDIKWPRNGAGNSTGNTTPKGKWLHKEDWFKKMPPSQIFAEALFGIAHGFDGAYPEGGTIATSANSSALQLGVGVDVTLWKNFGARLFELDYVRTGLPNGYANNQNDLRLSFGVNYTWNSPAQAAAAKSAVSATTAVPDADATFSGLMDIPAPTAFPVPPVAPSAPSQSGHASVKPAQ